MLESLSEDLASAVNTARFCLAFAKGEQSVLGVSSASSAGVSKSEIVLSKLRGSWVLIITN